VHSSARTGSATGRVRNGKRTTIAATTQLLPRPILLLAAAGGCGAVVPPSDGMHLWAPAAQQRLVQRDRYRLALTNQVPDNQAGQCQADLVGRPS